jgi:hypothetical protein
MEGDGTVQAEGAAHICAGTGLTPPTSAPGLGSPDLRLHRDWAHPCHICAGTGPTPTHICAGIGGCVLQVEHRKTFLFLEQIILKYHAQARPTQSTRSTPSSLSTLEYSYLSPSEWQVSAPRGCGQTNVTNIRETKDGIDFYYASRRRARSSSWPLPLCRRRLAPGVRLTCAARGAHVVAAVHTERNRAACMRVPRVPHVSNQSIPRVGGVAQTGARWRATCDWERGVCALCVCVCAAVGRAATPRSSSTSSTRSCRCARAAPSGSSHPTPPPTRAPRSLGAHNRVGTPGTHNRVLRVLTIGFGCSEQLIHRPTPALYAACRPGLAPGLFACASVGLPRASLHPPVCPAGNGQGGRNAMLSDGRWAAGASAGRGCRLRHSTAQRSTAQRSAALSGP